MKFVPDTTRTINRLNVPFEATEFTGTMTWVADMSVATVVHATSRSSIVDDSVDQAVVGRTCILNLVAYCPPVHYTVNDVDEMACKIRSVAEPTAL